MEKLEIKNDILYIADDQKEYQITLNAIDIACTDGFIINLKLYDGSQAYLHPEYEFVKEEFNALVQLLTQHSNFYQCDGYMVINLENLQEVGINTEKTHWDYYNLDMRFKRMKGGLASKKLDSLRKTEEEIIQAKQNYDATINNTVGG